MFCFVWLHKLQGDHVVVSDTLTFRDICPLFWFSVACDFQLLANAVAETATMSAEQVIKQSDGSEVTSRVSAACFSCIMCL